MASKKPAFRFIYKGKATGVKAEIGVLWPNDYGGFNLQAHTEPSESEYGKRLPFDDALKLAADKEGYINVWPIGDRNEDDGL